MELKLSIDKARLDEEWVDQAEQVHRWCVAQADAQLELDTRKNNLAALAAMLELQIREAPDAFGIVKVTEATIAAALAGNTRHKDALQKVAEARHALAVVQAAVEALAHRKRALTCLCDLFMADYFSTAAGNRPASKNQPAARPPGVYQRRADGDVDNDSD